MVWCYCFLLCSKQAALAGLHTCILLSKVMIATERKQAIRDSNMVQKVMTSVAGFQFARLVLQKAGKL